jgi:hypothetical protein
MPIRVFVGASCVSLGRPGTPSVAGAASGTVAKALRYPRKELLAEYASWLYMIPAHSPETNCVCLVTIFVSTVDQRVGPITSLRLGVPFGKLMASPSIPTSRDFARLPPFGGLRHTPPLCAKGAFRFAQHAGDRPVAPTQRQGGRGGPPLQHWWTSHQWHITALFSTEQKRDHFIGTPRSRAMERT